MEYDAVEFGGRLTMISKYLLHLLSGYINKPRFYFQGGMGMVTAGTEPFPGSHGTNRKRKNLNEAECIMDMTSVENGKQKGGITMKNV
jgi:hypothetical protein